MAAIPEAVLNEASIRFYRHALAILRDAGAPHLVGGAYAYARYTGIERHTKDFDVFVREPVRPVDDERCWRRSVRLTTLRVLGPTMPSGASPLSAWKRRTAVSVSGPKRPSTPGRPRL